jgi:hypothetical protein
MYTQAWRKAMSTRFRIILIILLVITFAVLINQIRNKKLQLQYSMNWMSMLLILLIVAIFPDLLKWLSFVSGVELPINIVFFLGFCFVLLIVYGLTSTVSKLSKENKELAQKVSLLDKRLKEIEKK